MKDDSAEAQAQLERSLASGKKLTGQLERDFKKIQSINIKGMKVKKKEIQDLTEEYENLTNAGKRHLKELEKEVKEMESAQDAIIKLTKDTKQLTLATKALE